MNRNDFKNKFPDVKVQHFETFNVLSKQDILNTVEQAITSLNMGLIYYQSSGKKITCFTSDKMKDALEKMVKGAKLTDPNTGEVGVITSDNTFLMCGEYCVNIDFPSTSGAYSCEYFID